MTATQLDLGTVVAASNQELDDTHTYCCRDVDVALCGLDVSDYSIDDDSETTCVVCADLENTNFCPKGYTCPYVVCE